MRDALGLVSSKGNDVLIISDANTIYIDQISEEKQIKSYINHVITNPAHFDENGRLHIIRHTRDDQHNCIVGCPPNLCKGRELYRFTESKSYEQLVYIGDGTNDFCPGTRLKATDFFLPRKGFRLSKMLENEVHRSKIKAKIIEWETADDVLSIVKSLLT
jgi:pyridoxal phosphate phosphatase PHOSPHO2